MSKEQGNRLDQIRSRQKQLKEDKIRTEKEKLFFQGFPPIGRDIVSRIVFNQNKLLISEEKNYNNLERNLENNPLKSHLHTSYCVPTLTKHTYQEETQS